MLLAAHAVTALGFCLYTLAGEPALESVRNGLFVYALCFASPLAAPLAYPVSAVALLLFGLAAAASIRWLRRWGRFAALLGLTVAWQVYGVYQLVAITGGA